MLSLVRFVFVHYVGLNIDQGSTIGHFLGSVLYLLPFIVHFLYYLLKNKLTS